MVESFINKCIELLNQEHIKKEIQNVVKPLINLFLEELYPYVYFSLLFIFINFILNLGVFIIILRNKKILLQS
jgi:hypothetical protein